jgi:hypothetical protein
MTKPLHEAINDVVAQYVTDKLKRREPADLWLITGEITRSLMDIVLDQEERHQGPLLAKIIGSLADDYLQRSGQAPNRRRDN